MRGHLNPRIGFSVGAVLVVIASILTLMLGAPNDRLAVNISSPTSSTLPRSTQNFQIHPGDARRQATIFETPATAGDSPSIAFGRLEVSVLGPQSEGLSARVEMFGRSERRKARFAREGNDHARRPLRVQYTDADGVAHFDKLPPGKFIVHVSEFPEGYIPPPSRYNQIALEKESGVDIDVSVSTGANELDVIFPLAATIAGHVIDDSGLGIEGVLVCAHLQTPDAFRDCYGRTDTNGYYFITCPPGKQRLRVNIEKVHPLFDLARPVPRNLDVVSGSAHREDFVLSRIGATVSGSIFDQDGLPVAGLYVLCYYFPHQDHLPLDERRSYVMNDYVQSTTTLTDGRFVLAGLPQARVAVQIGPEDYQPVGRGRLGMIVPAKIVDLTGESQLDVGHTFVYTSRPYRLLGEIQLNSIWAGPAEAATRLKLKAILPPGERRRRPREQKITLVAHNGEHLSFEWSCETPEGEVLLELSRTGNLLLQKIVVPQPSVTERIVLVLPE